MKITGALLGTVLLLAGCSAPAVDGADSPTAAAASSTATAAPSPTASPSPSPTVLGIKEAGAYYLSAVCPSNKAIDDVETAIFGSKQTIYFDRLTKTQIKKIRAAAAVAVKTTRDAARMIDSPPLPWPSSVRKPVEKIVPELLELVSKYQGLQDARTWQQVREGYYEKVKDTGSAQLIRLRLKLPPSGKGCKALTG